MTIRRRALPRPEPATVYFDEIRRLHNRR